MQSCDSTALDVLCMECDNSLTVYGMQIVTEYHKFP